MRKLHHVILPNAENEKQKGRPASRSASQRPEANRQLTPSRAIVTAGSSSRAVRLTTFPYTPHRSTLLSAALCVRAGRTDLGGLDLCFAVLDDGGHGAGGGACAPFPTGRGQVSSVYCGSLLGRSGARWRTYETSWPSSSLSAICARRLVRV